MKGFGKFMYMQVRKEIRKKGINLPADPNKMGMKEIKSLIPKKK